MGVNEIRELLAEATRQMKLVSTIYGPQWLSRLDEIHLLACVSLAEFQIPQTHQALQIPLDSVKKNLKDTAKNILSIFSLVCF